MVLGAFNHIGVNGFQWSWSIALVSMDCSPLAHRHSDWWEERADKANKHKHKHLKNESRCHNSSWCRHVMMLCYLRCRNVGQPMYGWGFQKFPKDIHRRFFVLSNLRRDQVSQAFHPDLFKKTFDWYHDKFHTINTIFVSWNGEVNGD